MIATRHFIKQPLSTTTTRLVGLLPHGLVALHPEQVRSLCERARGEVEHHHAAGHGGLHAGSVGGARRGALLLAQRRGEGGGDVAELRGQ